MRVHGGELGVRERAIESCCAHADDQIAQRALHALAVELQLRDAAPVQIDRRFFEEVDERIGERRVDVELHVQLLCELSFELDAQRRQFGDRVRIAPGVAEIDAAGIDLRIAQLRNVRIRLHAVIGGDSDDER